jgi:sulfur-oxidizing protein SoxA
MKKITSALVIMGVIFGLPLAAQADPASDLKAFRAYFKKKFPTVKLGEYHNGLYALPIAKDLRTEWEEIMVFPPYEPEVESGKKFWTKHNLGSCFKNKGVGIAQSYPRWDNKKKAVVTTEEDINACLKSKGLKPIKNMKKGTMAAVTAYFRSLSNGKKVKLDLSNPGMQAEYEYGKKFFWARRGQLNFSCATCHVQNAGMRIGGNILSPALGHTTGFPVYRSKWGGLGTIHRRYGGCNKQVRAKPFKAQSREYKALEIYETYMSTGIALRVPGQRG